MYVCMNVEVYVGRQVCGWVAGWVGAAAMYVSPLPRVCAHGYMDICKYLYNECRNDLT
jgi:hypothetical protein